MALTRKFLTALGIEADKVDEIITAHAETVDALKAERDQFKADAEKLPAVQKELDGLKAAEKGSSSFEVKYKALKEEFDGFKKDVEAKETKSKKEVAFRALLKEVGVSEKRLDAVVRVTDLDSVKLDDEGKIENAAELKKGIKEEWSDFIVSNGVQGATVSTPPASGKTYKTREEIMAIKDTAERQKAIAENHELFGF